MKLRFVLNKVLGLSLQLYKQKKLTKFSILLHFSFEHLRKTFSHNSGSGHITDG